MPSLEDRGQREREGRSIQDGRCCMIDGAAARDGASITAPYIRRGRWARPVRSCRCDCCSRATRSAGRRLAARPCTSSPPCPRARRPRSAHTRLRAKVARWRDGRAAGRQPRGAAAGATVAAPRRGTPWGCLTTSATRGDAGAAGERGPRASLPDLHLEVGGREHLHELRVGLGGEGRVDLVRVKGER